jgi:hypothetical protein
MRAVREHYLHPVGRGAVFITHRHARPKVDESAYVAPTSVLCGDVTLATGAMLFNGCRLGRGVEVESGAVVHVNTSVPEGMVVPMGWFAGGDPAELVPPGDRERIRELMGPLDYPGTVFGVSRTRGQSPMPDIARRYARALALHRYDDVLDPRQG